MSFSPNTLLSTTSSGIKNVGLYICIPQLHCVSVCVLSHVLLYVPTFSVFIHAINLLPLSYAIFFILYVFVLMPVFSFAFSVSWFINVYTSEICFLSSVLLHCILPNPWGVWLLKHLPRQVSSSKKRIIRPPWGQNAFISNSRIHLVPAILILPNVIRKRNPIGFLYLNFNFNLFPIIFLPSGRKEEECISKTCPWFFWVSNNPTS